MRKQLALPSGSQRAATLLAGVPSMSELAGQGVAARRIVGDLAGKTW